MNTKFPKLPDYGFSWRSIQVEPIPLSGERITIGAIIKGEDQALISAKLIPTSKMKALFGNSFSIRLIQALNLCVNSAEDFYKSNQLSNAWIPPLEGFHISKMSTSVSQNIEEGLYRAAMHCSSYCVSAELDNSNTETQTHISAPEYWRKDITQAVIKSRADFANNFGKSVTIQGSVGVPLKFGFISPNYAAHFDAISTPQMIQQGLVRAQSKLWQLDRLRDKGMLFQPDVCELLFRTPETNDVKESSLFEDFIEELRYEASRREIELYISESPKDAAKHLISKAA